MRGSLSASCESVVEEITQKIINNGVPSDSFTITVVSNEEAASQQGTVVGNCSNETQKIIYIILIINNCPFLYYIHNIYS
ncbi:TPA: DUF1161 domain-containing protein [Providencia alcalifaciens]